MDILQLSNSPQTPHLYTAPPCVARYTPVFWEPLPGTGERVVALVALEPHESSKQNISAGTFTVLNPERLRAMLGRQRGNSAHGVLKETAAFMTLRQQAGLPVDELKAPFHGFTMGPTMMGRGFTVEQLLDAAVRSVSAFGTSEEIVEEEAAREAPRHTIRTAEFLKSVKRIVTTDNPDLKSRFDRKIQTQGSPEWTVDYAHSKWLVQATSLPVTAKQFSNTQRETQSKMFELGQIAKLMESNVNNGVLLVNIEVLTHSSLDTDGRNEAEKMLTRLELVSQTNDLDFMRAESPQDAARMVMELS